MAVTQRPMTLCRDTDNTSNGSPCALAKRAARAWAAWYAWARVALLGAHTILLEQQHTQWAQYTQR